jgi:hypothetical protein
MANRARWPSLVTLLAVLGTTPYIALQLQSVTLSFSVFAGPAAATPDAENTAIWVAAGLALFTIVFGTRSLDVNERHPGLVSAIALEAVVKLVALLAVGVFVVWGVAERPGRHAGPDRGQPGGAGRWNGARWLGMTCWRRRPSCACRACFRCWWSKTRMSAIWPPPAGPFPLYLLLISLFVVPIAVVGLNSPPGDQPRPVRADRAAGRGRTGWRCWSFLGGFSAATSMVIVARWRCRRCCRTTSSCRSGCATRHEARCRATCGAWR